MKPSKLTVGLALAALLVGASVSQSALARGGHGHVTFGFHIGGPAYWGPWPYYYPSYYPAPYYAAPIVVQSPPQVYVEREAASAPETQSYWYYCGATRGYYPYVKECPGGWQKVATTPQN
jgi:hypothetical protein